MKVLFSWFRLRPRERVVIHPTRRVELAMSSADAFARCKSGIELALGGMISQADISSGTIEASFGLIDSERLTCTVQTHDSGSRVTIESRRGATLGTETRSRYADALAEYLQTS